MILLNNSQVLTEIGIKAIILYLGQLLGKSSYSNEQIIEYFIKIKL
jgi:hypothetical protein